MFFRSVPCNMLRLYGKKVTMPSMMNILAIGLYCCVALACVGAAGGAWKTGRPRIRQVHWLACTGWFVAMGISRLLSLEERVRDTLRDSLVSAQLYSERGVIQTPILAVLLVGLLGLGLWAMHRGPILFNGTGQRLIWLSRMGIAGLALLVLLRVHSLHFVDKILYSGPVRLNWVLDGSLTLLVGACAVFYLRYCLQNRLPAPMR